MPHATSTESQVSSHDSAFIKSQQAGPAHSSITQSRLAHCSKLISPFPSELKADWPIAPSLSRHSQQKASFSIYPTVGPPSSVLLSTINTFAAETTPHHASSTAVINHFYRISPQL